MGASPQIKENEMDNGKKMLEDHVQHIVNTIHTGMDSIENEGESMDAYEYLSDILDINYILNSKKECIGARVLVAFGGPNIWIDTHKKQVEGYWWQDKCTIVYFEDSMGIEEAVKELYNC
jgi:hypothetical protein